MGLYKNTNGVLTPIAGRGKAEYGASTVRTGNVAVNIAGGGTNPMEVTFDTPMPDANYMVDCTITDQQLSKQIITVEKKTANGFILYVTNVYTNALSYNIKYTAFKLYTDNEYNELLDQANDKGTQLLQKNVAGTYSIGANDYKFLVIILEDTMVRNSLTIPVSLLSTTEKRIEVSYHNPVNQSYYYYADVYLTKTSCRIANFQKGTYTTDPYVTVYGVK